MAAVGLTAGDNNAARWCGVQKRSVDRNVGRTRRAVHAIGGSRMDGLGQHSTWSRCIHQPLRPKGTTADVDATSIDEPEADFELPVEPAMWYTARQAGTLLGCGSLNDLAEDVRRNCVDLGRRWRPMSNRHFALDLGFMTCPHAVGNGPLYFGVSQLSI